MNPVWFMSQSSDPTNKVKSAFTPMRSTVLEPVPKPAASQVVTSPSSAANPQANQPTPPEHPTAMYDVAIQLRIVRELPRGEPIMIRSALSSDGTRAIVIQLSSSDLLVGRALKKCDTLLVRFLCCASIAEYLNYWRKRSDGLAMRAAVLQAAGVPSGENFWGLGLAGRLARSPLLKSLDSAPIYGPAPTVDTVELCRLGVMLRVVSDLPNWRPRTGERKESANLEQT